MSYAAPIKEMLFVPDKLVDIAKIATLPGFEDANLEMAQIVLEEAAKFTAEIVAPLNFEGDKHPGKWRDGEVVTTAGFKEVFRKFAEGGWQGVMHPAEFGGQGLSEPLLHPVSRCYTPPTCRSKARASSKSRSIKDYL